MSNSLEKWYLRFIVGNPFRYTKIRTANNDRPMKRGAAVKLAKSMDHNLWRVWVEDIEGNRIYESTWEQKWKIMQAGGNYEFNPIELPQQSNRRRKTTAKKT